MIFLGFILSILGLFALLFLRQNFISALVAIELILLGVSVISIGYSLLFDLFEGQLFSLFILTSAAAESALGLALLVQFYRAKGRIDYNFFTFLKG
jgi:NADH-quinone oxidoreductase subunit K